MRIYVLFIMAFAVIATSFYKAQVGSAKKSSAKKQRVAQVEPQWPGVMKKSSLGKAGSSNSKKILEEVKAEAAELATSKPSSPKKINSARGIASIGNGASSAESARKKALYTGANFKARGYSSRSFYYGVYTPESIAAQAQAQAAQTSRQANYLNSNDLSAQELSSFTRTADLSINVNMDPELAETFEDQVRKFREQNQLTAQELQQLEMIINNFVSMSNSVQRGQVPLPQVNAEAIKLTRSFLILKKRVEARSQ